MGICHYTVCMLSDFRGQKRALDCLKLELHMLVNHQVAAGSCKSSQCSFLTTDPSLQPLGSTFLPIKKNKLD